MTYEYAIALETSRASARKFSAIRADYFAGKIDDATFLAAKAEDDAASKVFDEVYKKEQNAMTPDFEYVQSADGFISLMPNSDDAIATYNSTFPNGAYRLLPQEFAAFKAQARKAGYTVRKSKPVSLATLAEMDQFMESTR